MYCKLQIFFCLVAFAAAQSVSRWGNLGFGMNQNLGIINSQALNSLGRGDVEDQMILKNLVRLDAVNRPLARRLLQLNIAERQIVGDLARGINHVTIKKGAIYPLTLWDRVLKIKGANTPFGVHNVATQNNIENNWIQTEIEEQQILEDLIKVGNVDGQIVTSLLVTDIVDRKIVADLAEAINRNTIRRGPAYPRVLLQTVAQINGVGNTFGGIFGGANQVGGVLLGVQQQTGCVFCNRGLELNRNVNLGGVF